MRRDNGKLEIYKAKDGWRWRVIANNGNILADSGQAYGDKRDCCRGITSLQNYISHGWVGDDMRKVGYDLEFDLIKDRYVVKKYECPKP